MNQDKEIMEDIHIIKNDDSTTILKRTTDGCCDRCYVR